MKLKKYRIKGYVKGGKFGFGRGGTIYHMDRITDKDAEMLMKAGCHLIAPVESSKKTEK